MGEVGETLFDLLEERAEKDEIDSKIKEDFEKVEWMSNTKTAQLTIVVKTYYGWLVN